MDSGWIIFWGSFTASSLSFLFPKWVIRIGAILLSFLLLLLIPELFVGGKNKSIFSSRPSSIQTLIVVINPSPPLLGGDNNASLYLSSSCNPTTRRRVHSNFLFYISRFHSCPCHHKSPYNHTIAQNNYLQLTWMPNWTCPPREEQHCLRRTWNTFVLKMSFSAFRTTKRQRKTHKNSLCPFYPLFTIPRSDHDYLWTNFSSSNRHITVIELDGWIPLIFG